MKTGLTCSKGGECEFPAGVRGWVTGRGCNHDLHVDNAPGTSPVRCKKCHKALGRECPNCEGVY